MIFLDLLGGAFCVAVIIRVTVHKTQLDTTKLAGNTLVDRIRISGDGESEKSGNDGELHFECKCKSESED